MSWGGGTGVGVGDRSKEAERMKYEGGSARKQGSHISQSVAEVGNKEAPSSNPGSLWKFAGFFSTPLPPAPQAEGQLSDGRRRLLKPDVNTRWMFGVACVRRLINSFRTYAAQ